MITEEERCELIKQITKDIIQNNCSKNSDSERCTTTKEITNKLLKGCYVNSKLTPLVEEAKKYKTVKEFLEFLFDDGAIKYHVSSNPDLKEFVDISRSQKSLNRLKKRRDELNTIITKAYNEAVKTSDWTEYWKSVGDYDDELAKIQKEITIINLELPETGMHGIRGGVGVYLTSRPFEWRHALADQGIDLGNYVYEVYIINPVKRIEYLQVVGSIYGELPETVIQPDEGIIIAKKDEFDYVRFFHNVKHK